MQYTFALSIVLGQFTTLVIYLNIITQNFETYFPHSHGSARLAILVSVVVVLGLFSLIPTLRGVAWLSAAGLSLYAFLFIALIAEFLHKANAGTLPNSSYMVMTPTGSHYGEWFGVACFAFSGFPICMVMYEEMRNKPAFKNVVGLSFGGMWFIYSVFAVLGFLCYGEQTDLLIYMNFPPGSTFREGSAGAISCILCFSFVVQAMPIFNCTSRVWEATGLSSKTPGMSVAIVRWTVLALTVAVAFYCPSVKVLMNTVGAVTGVFAGFILPAATYIKLSSSDEWLERARCVVVMVVGVMGAYYSCTSHTK